MDIKVIYVDGTVGTVPSSELDLLMAQNKIASFHRSGEWINLGTGPIRKNPASMPYLGPKKRESDKK